MIGIRILVQDILPPGTIIVSPDIYKLLREQYTEEGKDAALLKAMGITTKEQDAKS